MLFVDGENLTIRGQDFASANSLKLSEGPYYKKDAFLWMANALPVSVPEHNSEVYTLEECAL
jgi:hypothetical protein